MNEIYERNILKWIAASIAIIALTATGYPGAFYATHGMNPAGWPNEEILRMSDANLVWVTPERWWKALRTGDIGLISNIYIDMLFANVETLPKGGRPWLIGIVVAAIPWLMPLFATAPKEPKRDPSNLHGGARWANRNELSALKIGVEIGLNPASGKPVRLPIESNLISIAPPRSGKTTGLVLPNLLAVDKDAFAGPVIVVDPKGDAYRATKARREELGYRVVRIDPLGLIDGEGDRWDPLEGHSAEDVVSLQAIAATLPPPSQHTSDGGQFYRQLATDHIAAAIASAFRDGQPNAPHVAELARDADKLREALNGRSDALSKSVLNILNSEDGKVRDNVISTASQAFSWSLDEKIQRYVSNATFKLTDIVNGKTDIFVILPADNRKDILAPLVRWLLCEIFATVRRQRLNKRILVIIDEANSLGAFDALAQALGELPGYGLSFWTFWQSRHQLVRTFGEAGAAVFFQTAEVTTLSNLDATTPDEADRWSKAIGKFTHIEEVRSTDAQTRKDSASRRSVGVDLVPASDLPALTSKYLIAFLNSKRATTAPMKLIKNHAPTDRRFQGRLTPVEPVGATDAPHR